MFQKLFVHIFIILIVAYCYATSDYFIFFYFCARALFDVLILSHLSIVRNSQYHTGFSFLFCAYILIYPRPHHYRLTFCVLVQFLFKHYRQIRQFMINSFIQMIYTEVRVKNILPPNLISMNIIMFYILIKSIASLYFRPNFI